MPQSRQPHRVASETGGGDVVTGVASLGILEVLAQDPRPTFILDLRSMKETKQSAPIVYRNPALHSRFALNELISGRAIGHAGLDYIRFRDWALHQEERGNYCSSRSRRAFADMSWTAYTVRSSYRIISGHLEDGVDPVPSVASQGGDNLPRDAGDLQHFDDIRASGNQADCSDSTSFTSAERHAFGCTDLEVPENRFSPFVQFFRSVDWSSTALGNINEWPMQLHQMCNFLMNDPTPAYVLWGKELIVIYNEAAIQVLLDRHPRVMGLPLQVVYPEVWDQISILIRKVQKTGKAVRVEDVPMLLKRRERMDECFFSFQYQPITDERGTVVGIYEPFVDVTRQNHAARRMTLLLEISTCSSVAKDLSDFWRLLLAALETSVALPFAMLYTLEGLQRAGPAGSKRNSASIEENTLYCELEGQLGIPEGHVTLINRLGLSNNSGGYGPAMSRSMETRETVFLSTKDGSLPEEFVNGIDLRGITTPANTVVVWPICPTGRADTVGFLVAGLNPHLGLDEGFREFLDIMIRQIATSVAAVMLFEEEVRHREEVARQLDLRTKELLKSEMKFQHMAENSMVGISTADPEGNLVYANQAFYDITGHNGKDNTRESWIELFSEGTASSLTTTWTQLYTVRKPIVAEFPLKKPWTKVIGNGEVLKGPTWILISAFVEEDVDGSLLGSLATVTDISQQKWAEEHQKRRMEEAMELKRQQEVFVDMTSHEIRNPLSAILQSADSISSSLAACFSSVNKDAGIVSVEREILEENMDAADTITLCAQHQKRIVDDILTLSKMDADMLLVTPVDVEPLKIVQHVVKMFETESAKHNIAVKVEVESSFHKLKLESVQLDPSRLTQVLVNIVGNAIKFTRLVEEKRITIKIGGSADNPGDTESGIEYIRPHETTIPSAFMNDSKKGSQTSFLRIAVHDTGPGLKPMERERLFKRFGQASPRTEVEYGGSGLGLFISKKLSELQGGGIGLASNPGKGSTFAFYVLVRRLEKPNVPSNIDITQRNESIREAALPHSRSIELLMSPRSPTPDSIAGRPATTTGGIIPLQRKLAILVVEDNLVNQRVLCKQLQNLGHVVHASNHGKEALDFLEQSANWIANGDEREHVDIVLLDTEMPVMDGLTCARRIRDAERRGLVKRHVPIISVTANARSEQVELAAAAGMDDAISKPFRVADLVPKMDELVRKYGS